MSSKKRPINLNINIINKNTSNDTTTNIKSKTDIKSISDIKSVSDIKPTSVDMINKNNDKKSSIKKKILADVESYNKEKSSIEKFRNTKSDKESDNESATKCDEEPEKLICECGKEFLKCKRFFYERHRELCINNKFPQFFECEYCLKKLMRNGALKKHQELNCKVLKKMKSNNTTNTQTIICKINDINDNEEYANTSNEDIDTSDVSNESITMALKIIPFNETSINDLTCIELEKLFLSEKNLIEELVIMTNLNPDKPQYHNILFTNVKSSDGTAYEKNGWIDDSIDNIINTLINFKIKDLKLISNFEYFSNPDHKQRIINTSEKFGNKNCNSRKKIIKRLKLLFHDNHDMIRISMCDKK